MRVIAQTKLILLVKGVQNNARNYAIVVQQDQTIIVQPNYNYFLNNVTHDYRIIFETMFKQEIDQLMNKPQPSSSEEDEATSSIHNLNKQLEEFEHRFKGYHSQKPFSDSDSQQQAKPSFNPKIEVKDNKQSKQQQSRLSEIKDQIKWKDTEIQQLLKLEGDGPKDKKIKQLAQKVKLLSINLEKQKNNNNKKKQELQNTAKLSVVISPNDMKKSIKPSDDGDLKNKLIQSEKQVMEMRLKNQNLKNQLNKAMRVISKQIGEDANIDDILSQQNAWKGRQQKIEHLKGRVKELEGKLSSNGHDVSHMSGFTMMSNQKTSRQQTTINGLSDNRRKEMENLKIQVQAVKSQNQILQGKVKALASRKGTLETEVKQIKTEFEKKQKIFKEKSQNDDKYISLLKAENQKMKKEKDDKVITKLVYKNSNSNDADESKKQIQKLKSLLSKRDLENKQLQEKIQTLARTKQQPKSREAQPPSSDKTKKVIQKKIEELQKQYMDEDNAQQSITAEEEQAIYKQWKQQKLKSGK